ncbi:macrophage mannose receptor 1-like [Huso huso]|uniref:Macrophage mannose receptor 1-like n=1 Tax=Huso huso TaxID=61971 RepID=A0ABR0YAU6_HUSHU
MQQESHHTSVTDIAFDLLCVFTETSNITARYTLIEEPRNWTEAQQYCREHHIDLVSIKSASENEDLVKKAQGKTFWIGLFNNPWKWSHQGDNYTFHNWNTGEPNNWRCNEKCVEIAVRDDPSRGKWNDQDCKLKRPFFCFDGKDPCPVCVLVQLKLKTWTEAQQYCREHHTDLVSIKNASENEDLVKKAQVKPFWIGLFNNPWKWSRQGDNYTFQNWADGEPNNEKGNEKCVVMNEIGKWYDSSCSSKAFVVCCSGKDPSLACVPVVCVCACACVRVRVCV